MWSKWPLFALMLVACSGEGDELEAPMLGDCANCGTAPVSGGGISGGGGADAAVEDAGTGNFDALTSVDVGVIPDVSTNPDVDMVDVGVSE